MWAWWPCFLILVNAKPYQKYTHNTQNACFISPQLDLVHYRYYKNAPAVDDDDEARKDGWVSVGWVPLLWWVGGCPCFPSPAPHSPPPAAPTAAPTFPQPAMQRSSSSEHCTGHWIFTSGDGAHVAALLAESEYTDSRVAKCHCGYMTM